MKLDSLKKYSALKTALETERAKLTERLAAINAALTGEPAPAKSAVKPGKKGRRRMSAEAKKRISEAAKKRWAKFRAAKGKA